jgi:hypothetical protein
MYCSNLLPTHSPLKMAAQRPALAEERHYDPLPTDPDIIDRWRQLQQCRVDGINRRIEALLQQAGLTPDWLNAA